MPARVLFVDDNPLHLRAMERTFRGLYEVTVASSGHEALDLVLDSPPFAVVVCDMRMPGMDGVELLQEIQTLSPDSIRIMLTGQEDQLTAVEALNGGNVFRFLTKPCDTMAVAAVLEAGVRQHDLLCSSRVLLEETLAGSVQVLVDLLSVFDPKAFGLAQETRAYALRIAGKLGIPSPWDLGLAALLAPVGRMALPLPIQSKLNWSEPLTPSEQAIHGRVPESAARIVGNIPRLQPVARIIRYAAKNFDGAGYPEDGVRGEEIPLESRILRVLTDFLEGLRLRGSKRVVLEKLKLERGLYDPRVLGALEELLEAPAAAEGLQRGRRAVTVRALEPGMCLLEDLCTPEGALVLAAGTRLAQIHLERLRSVASLGRRVEPVMVEG
ncbi:HD domain-containing phosphohydrolase [Mesoterricola silvestris]|uniref:Response regulator receiver modulated metal-depenent phosphohydrolase n=1 Tax=Mesoterricola silvestris TaxID=2927979 RepID=A0AA48GTI8_9BACT|nr:HD domain-containing phosphohydrolase [Mesoterricola silvestris]BDU74070.1 response regulator receiver modulated metal-depenent phosphohydrolase [Mesoterricola silvestris]